MALPFDPNAFILPVQGLVGDPLNALQNGISPQRDIPDTATRTRYSISLEARVGKRMGRIGAVSKITRNESVALEDLYEINVEASGLPRDIVPQILSNRTINIERYELYRDPFSRIFGKNTELHKLCDQTSPIILRITKRTPSASSLLGNLARAALAAAPDYEVHEFPGYFESMGEVFDTQNPVVGVQASFRWLDHRVIRG